MFAADGSLLFRPKSNGASDKQRPEPRAGSGCLFFAEAVSNARSMIGRPVSQEKGWRISPNWTKSAAKKDFL
jgi:hypothetical protein